MAGKEAAISIGTTSGLYKVNVPTGTHARLGLPHHHINNVLYRAGTLLAACPKLGKLHQGMAGPQGLAQYAGHVPGLHAMSPVDVTSWEDPPDAKLLWQGDARSCTIMDTEQGTTRLLVGTEPADVFVSDDWGSTWSSGTQSFADAQSRPKWYFPVEPHIPHVLSIDFGLDQDGSSRVLVAGVEVGGCMVSKDGGLSWEERSNGLCPDVHSIRVDPFAPGRWYAVTGGSDAIPGGLYGTTDSGASWRQLLPCNTPSGGFMYFIGLSISPYKPGELLVTAGDKPPSRGSHIFSSLDGGETFVDITSSVYSDVLDELQERSAVPAGLATGAPASEVAGHMGLTEESKEASPANAVEAMKQSTPVPLFTKAGMALGMCTGDVVFNASLASGGWKSVCRLPARITSMVGCDNVGSPSSVSH